MKGSLLIAALVVVAAPAAHAQLTTQLLLNQTTPLYGNTTYPGGFHKVGCQQDTGQFQLSWQNMAATGTVGTGVGVGGVGSTYGIPTFQAFACDTQPAVTDSSCTSSAAGDAGTATGLLNITNGIGVSYLNVDPRSLIAGVVGESDPCDATPPPTGTVYVCVAEQQENVYYGGGTTTTNQCLIFPYDMNPPPAPTGLSVTSADSELDVSFNFPYDPNNTIGDDADHFIVFLQPDSSLTPNIEGQCGSPAVDTVDPTSWPVQSQLPTPIASGNSTAITGLKNAQCYDVSVIAYYADGTVGTPSPVVAAAPIEVWDYWRIYHAAGGQDQGGAHCQSAGGALAPIALLLVGLFAVSQRRRRAR